MQSNLCLVITEYLIERDVYSWAICHATINGTAGYIVNVHKGDGHFSSQSPDLSVPLKYHEELGGSLFIENTLSATEVKDELDKFFIYTLHQNYKTPYTQIQKIGSTRFDEKLDKLLRQTESITNELHNVKIAMNTNSWCPNL